MTYAHDATRGRMKGAVGAGAVDESFIAHYQATVAAASNTATKAALALTDSAQAGVTAGLTQPDVPRSLIVKGNASGNAGNVVIHGTAADGSVISETFALNGATAVEGNKAFLTVTSIDFPAETHAGTDTVSIGRGSKLGLVHKLAHNSVLFAALNNVREATAPTVTISTSAIESNTVLLNSALAAQVVDLYYVV